MEIRYCCTHWGSEDLSSVEFLDKVAEAGFSGIEINLSPGNTDGSEFFDKLEQLRQDNFTFIAQLVPDGFDDTPKQHTNRMKERLEYLAGFRPDFINSHTGRDFFSFDDNCRIIDELEDFAAKLGVQILHETHRGRFSFHLPTLLPYLKKFPGLQLTADFSHWCNVSESLLEGQTEMLSSVIPNIGHVHARVGWAQSAQINNPFAPEWNQQLAVFLGWWKSIAEFRCTKRSRLLTITPEAGPFPYMPEVPFSREPLADQWQINLQMKEFLKQNLS